jgi:hypothetical protein
VLISLFHVIATAFVGPFAYCLYLAAASRLTPAQVLLYRKVVLRKFVLDEAFE